MRARLIAEVGTRAMLRVYVSEPGSPRLPCPNPNRRFGRGGGLMTYHDASVRLVDGPALGDWGIGGDKADYSPDRWPQACDGCDRAWDEILRGEDPSLLQRMIFRTRLYDTADGEPAPGDLFWADWKHWPEPCSSWRVPTTCGAGWSNCDGRHLIAVLPNGQHWDIDSRASNCTLLEDQEHRCWVRTGDPPALTAGKGGRTCSAGAGSISVPGWHGFLVAGEFRRC